MEKFAVILKPDGGKRLIGSHPILKRLPVRAAHKCLPCLSAQKAGVIVDSDHHETLGAFIDVPGFFENWNQIEEAHRIKTVKSIVRVLEKMKIHLLCFPQMHQFFTEEEIHCLQQRDIVLSDGFHHRLAGMLLVLKQLLTITAAQAPYFEVGIWGADTHTGQIWVEAMAGEVNRMCIGGQDIGKLKRLAEITLRTTGLACQVTDKPEICLSDKNITVLAEPAGISISKIQPSFHFLSIPGNRASDFFCEAGDNMQRIYNIEMGWMAPPRDVEVLKELDPWEELGVLDGLFHVVSRVYREDIRINSLTFNRIKRLHTLYELYPVKLQGFIHQGSRIHFDRFRREYFKAGPGVVKIQ